jgi:hypothetical protein
MFLCFSCENELIPVKVLHNSCKIPAFQTGPREKKGRKERSGSGLLNETYIAVEIQKLKQKSTEVVVDREPFSTGPNPSRFGPV